MQISCPNGLSECPESRELVSGPFGGTSFSTILWNFGIRNFNIFSKKWISSGLSEGAGRVQSSGQFPQWTPPILATNKRKSIEKYQTCSPPTHPPTVVFVNSMRGPSNSSRASQGHLKGSPGPNLVELSNMFCVFFFFGQISFFSIIFWEAGPSL